MTTPIDGSLSIDIYRFIEICQCVWQTICMPAVSLPTVMLPLIDDVAACCSPLTGGALDDAQAERLALIFKALGDPTRVKLVSLIAATDTGEACICDLTEPVGLTQPTVSHHMKLLAEAGLVTREQRGKWAYYRVDTDTLRAVAQAVSPAAGR
jgi:ArsR family transcriptional regulator